MFCDNCVTDKSDVREVSVEGMEVNALLCSECIADGSLTNLDIEGE